jgi:soluble lytic murein transglycosylase-like protein
MRRVALPLLLASSLALAGCFPRLAQYGGDPAPAPQPAAELPPFDPARSAVPVERLLAFIMQQNPFLTPSDARRQAEAIARQAGTHGVPVHLVVSLIATESSFNPRAVSPVGAQGLGQLMPATAKDMGISDPFDVEQNIYATTRYLAWLGKVWEKDPRRWELVLASYLAGVGTVSKQVKAGRSLTSEQDAYVRKILRLSAKV